MKNKFVWILINPITIYFKWLFSKKIFLEWKHRRRNLRLDLLASPRNVQFGRYNWLAEKVRIENSKLGDYTYVASNSVIFESEIGKFCSIGPNVRTSPGKHPTHTIVSTHPSIYSNTPLLQRRFVSETYYNPSRQVVIGNDVWIGANSIIADGVTIGDGAIIAGNSLVNRDVPAYAIVCGVPAKVLKYRFSESQIDFLIRLEWWNKSDSWIENNADAFRNIEMFVNNVQ